MKFRDISEARIVGHPEINYTDKPKNKKSNDIDRVIATLSGGESGKFTRVAKKYAQINRIEKLIKEQREKLNGEVKDKFAVLFDVQDKIHTRVIETASLLATLSKETPAQTEFEEFDEAGFEEELGTLLDSLGKSLEDLRQKYTQIVPIVDPVPPSPKLMVKVKEAAGEGNKLSQIFQWVQKYAHAMINKLNGWDQQFAALKAQVGK